MFKRVLLIAAGAFLLGQIAVIGLQLLQGHNPLPSAEAGRRANEFEEVIRLINHNYVRESDATYDKLTTTALESLLRSLDPHSEFMTKREVVTFREDTSQEFGGIGVQIEMRDKRLTVVAPMPGTPGEQAGLLRGDQFLKVDDHNVDGLPLDECLAFLRGKPGSKVALTIFRPHTGETLEKPITRENIKVESVRDTHMITPDIGYVRILQFGEHTGTDFVKALETLEPKGMKGLILDLRDNPGGLLDVAVEVAQPFFDKGELVVYTQGRDPKSRDDIRSETRGPRRNYPIAVLINSGSASASEIVAGTLKDMGRAVLVGEKSFGKGSVQTIYPIQGGKEAIRLTTALYYLPSGLVINGKGIEPHIPVTLTADEDRKLAIQRNRLALMTPEEFKQQFEFDPIEDRQVTAAVDALRGVFAFTALTQAQSPTEKETKTASNR